MKILLADLFLGEIQDWNDKGRKDNMTAATGLPHSEAHEYMDVSENRVFYPPNHPFL